MTARTAWAAALLCAATASAVALLGTLPSPWDGWRPASCMPDRCFCEAIRPRLVRQPANTVSGAAFLVVAVLALHPGRAGAAAVYRGLFAAAIALVGAGTMFYHASLTFWGQTADVLGMYLVVSFVVLHGASRWRALPSRTLARWYVLMNATLLALLIVLPHLRRYVFALLVVLAVLLQTLGPPTAYARRPYFGAAVVVLFAGYLVWLLDLTRRWCAPDSWLQGHAVWHLAGAIASFLVFRHLTGEPRTHAADTVRT